jgi:hypothetical protein
MKFSYDLVAKIWSIMKRPHLKFSEDIWPKPDLSIGFGAIDATCGCDTSHVRASEFISRSITGQVTRLRATLITDVQRVSSPNVIKALDTYRNLKNLSYKYFVYTGLLLVFYRTIKLNC